MIGYGFGHDDEVPGGFQDADIEMRELEDAAQDEREHEQIKSVSGAKFLAWPVEDAENERIGQRELQYREENPQWQYFDLYYPEFRRNWFRTH